MSTLHTVYMGVLAKRLRKEMKGKGIILENQTGFRKELDTINIYVINYIVNRQLEKRGRNLVAFFMAAFDSIDKGILGKTIRERGIRTGLIRSMKKALSKQEVEWG